MNEIVGLAVLAWPAVLLLAIFAAVAATLVLALTRARPMRKLALASAVLLVAGLASTWDELLGGPYFKHLCKTEGGVRVYKNVELPKEYWDDRGLPKFADKYGRLDTAVLGKRFVWRDAKEPIKNLGTGIDRLRWQLVDTTTNDVLAEKVTFLRHYGWLHRFASLAPNVGETCGRETGDHQSNEVARKGIDRNDKALVDIFTPAAGTK